MRPLVSVAVKEVVKERESNPRLQDRVSLLYGYSHIRGRAAPLAVWYILTIVD